MLFTFYMVFTREPSRMPRRFSHTSLKNTKVKLQQAYTFAIYYNYAIIKQQIFMKKTAVLNTLVTMTVVSDVENSKN